MCRRQGPAAVLTFELLLIKKGLDHQNFLISHNVTMG
jgi:hypothetical protein